VLGVSLRLVLLLGVGPASGAAQATGGFTTAFTLATEAAARGRPAARRAGHLVKVVETHRTAERQAYFLVSGGGLTFTATSKHSSGRAVDVIVSDGNLKHRRTRARWIAFRRWVSEYEGGRFRLIGQAEKSWDWPHIELRGPMGYRSIEALLLAAPLMGLR
jgi:hypothetical protein